MPLRQLAVGSGVFLQTDPIPGGSCNPYDYTCQDPVNMWDLTGTAELAMGEGGGTSASDAIWLQGYELIFGAGVYKFASHNGLPYIGRTKDVWRRIQEHVRSGKLDPEDIGSIEFVEVNDGIEAQRFLEQDWINASGGIKRLENRINSIAGKYWEGYGIPDPVESELEAIFEVPDEDVDTPGETQR